MRCATAAQAKARRFRREVPLQEAPKGGSRLRRNYDTLQANKGLPIKLEGGPVSIATHLVQLSDFYGLDVRTFQRGFHRAGFNGARDSLYVLAGEWFGRVYIDYIAEHLEAAQ